MSNLGNCPPTPPLSQHWHFLLRAKFWHRGVVGGAVSQKRIMIHNFFVGDELDNWIKIQNWTLKEDGKVFICNQDAHIKSKNIAEKIDFDSKWTQCLSFTNVTFWYIFYFVQRIHCMPWCYHMGFVSQPRGGPSSSSPFKSQEWPTSIFSKQYQYMDKRKSHEN